MFSKLKGWLTGGVGMLVAALFFWGKHQSDKRAKAEHKARVERSSREAVEAANDAAKRVQEASHAQREKNEQARQKRREQEPDSRFTGRVDLGRLRNRSDD